MTRYSAEELSDDWEFKIVRSDLPVFRKRERLQQLLDEEAHAGWVMLEKLDNQRVRFKRPRSARAQDGFLPPDVDPYRTQYGGLVRTQVLILTLLLTMGLVAFTVLLVFAAR